MDNIYKKIASQLLPIDSECINLETVRIKCLYGYALEVAHEKYSSEFDSLCEYITYVERIFMIQTMSHLNDFKQVQPKDIIEYYSLISFELAKRKFKTNKSILLASLLRDALNELLNDEGLVTNEVKEKYKRMISETFLDFMYASGTSNNTSLRMMPFIREY